MRIRHLRTFIRVKLSMAGPLRDVDIGIGENIDG